MITRQVARFKRSQHANCADQMFVHRVVMIHVELHHRDDFAELGHEASQHTRLVHHAQNSFRVA